MTRVVSFGEAAFLVELEQRIDPAVAAQARSIADAWEAEGHGPGLPTYAAALLRFDPLALDADSAEAAAKRIAKSAMGSPATRPGKLVEIPTRYDGEDLEEVARMSGLSVAELIAAHTGREHHAYFVGFVPGFAYLGSTDPRIVAPRRPSPRPRVPSGAVAVADGQTGVYPSPTPGGWRLLGSTDVRMFDVQRDPPALIRSGDRVRFIALP